MSRVRNSAELFATLIVFWVLLNGTLAPQTLLVGIVAALAIVVFYTDGMSFLSAYRPVPRSFVATFQFLGYFLKELVRSNIALARIVLSPALPIKPGIVKVRTKLTSPMGRLLLANSITLTPGTLSVELDGDWLYVHWVTVEGTDNDVATAKIVAGFERYLEVMYG